MAQVSINKVYPHPPEKVWRALTDAQAMSEWLMPNDFEPRVRHRFTFRTDPAPGFDGIVHCEVRELTQHERLSFTWVGGPVQLTPEDRTDSAEDHMSGWTRVWARIGRLFMDRRQS